MQGEAEEFHKGEVYKSLLTTQKSHLAEALHLKTAGGWKGRSLFPAFCALCPTQWSQPPPQQALHQITTGWMDHWSDPKAILCSYSQFCPDGLFLLLLYSSLPEQSPVLFLAFTQIAFITCRESKISPVLQCSSCFTSAGHCCSGGCCRLWQCFP